MAGMDRKQTFRLWQEWVERGHAGKRTLNLDKHLNVGSRTIN